jgi:DNA-directed RNA polymerase subunit M/transcription elongation factor TFIIS
MVNKATYVPVSEPGQVREKARGMIDAVVGDARTSNFLEKASWNHAVEFCKKKDQTLNWENFAFRNAYTQKILSVRYNLKLRPDLTEQMKKGEHSIKVFVFAKPWEICPDKWTEAFESAAKKALRYADADSIDPEKMPDGMLQCGKCKSKKTTFFELQTRLVKLLYIILYKNAMTHILTIDHKPLSNLQFPMYFLNADRLMSLNVMGRKASRHTHLDPVCGKNV